MPVHKISLKGTIALNSITKYSPEELKGERSSHKVNFNAADSYKTNEEIKSPNEETCYR